MNEYLPTTSYGTANSITASGGTTSDRARASARSSNREVTGRWRSAALLVASLALVAMVAFLGREWTDTADGSWYDQLDKPAWTPPGATFGIVWTALYFMMAVAAWLIARQGVRRPGVTSALIAYLVQLALNLGWTTVFFAAERPGWAVAEIVLLLAAVAVTVWRFQPLSHLAAGLLVPYLLWVVYAASLTIGIAVLNR